MVDYSKPVEHVYRITQHNGFSPLTPTLLLISLLLHGERMEDTLCTRESSEYVGKDLRVLKVTPKRQRRRWKGTMYLNPFQMSCESSTVVNMYVIG